jgi:hypothetical protein
MGLLDAKLEGKQMKNMMNKQHLAAYTPAGNIFENRRLTILPITLLLLMLGISQMAFTQNTGLTGKIVDEKGTPLRFANIALLRGGDSTLVTGILTDSIGQFNMPAPAPGTYLLRISSIGWVQHETPIFEWNNTAGKHFGTITLKTDAKSLQGVTVESLRPTITQLADRLVVGIEGTALASGNTAFGVLSRAPGIFVDPEGNIQMNGRSGVLVMINGKQTFLSARDLRNLLESMPAENIKNLELITNPSAKYDAEGTSGILNINLKKNTVQGINGSVYSGILLNEKDIGFTSGFSINHKSGKWNSFLTLDAAKRVGGRTATFTRVFLGSNQNTYFDQTATGSFSNLGPPSVRVGTDYELNDRHSIGTVFNFIQNTGENEFLTQTFLGNAPKTPNQYIEANNYSRNTFRRLTSNLHYTGKMDTIGSTLSADFDYVKITNRGTADFYNFYTKMGTNQTRTDFLHTYTPNGYDIYSGKIDYSKQLSRKRKIEFGTRVSQVVSDNDFRFYFNNGTLTPDPLRTNHFKYREAIYAGYVNWSSSLGKKLTLQTGLRAENTVSKSELITTGWDTSRNYLNLFPSIFLQHKVSDNYGVNYSYSRRLSRPGYGNLNPFRFYRDPYTYSQGNPDLTPQYTHALSITQTFRKTYNLTFNYMLYKDMMAELPYLDVNNSTTIYTTGNVDDGFYVGATAIAPLKIMKGWDTQNTLSLSYNKLSIMMDNKLQVNDQVNYFLQSNHTILLPKNIRADLTFWYSGPAASGLYMIDPMWRTDIGFRKTVLNKKMDISVNATDIFKSQRYKFATNINGNINDFDQYMRFRTFSFNVRYNFSKGQKVDTKRRNSNLEELNRT